MPPTSRFDPLSEADKLLREGAPIGFRTLPIQERIRQALQRIRDGHAYMRIPADQTDPDIVLADCLTLLTAGSEKQAQKPRSINDEPFREAGFALAWLEGACGSLIGHGLPENALTKLRLLRDFFDKEDGK